MIDLLILAFVAKWFFDLAKKFKKPRKWIYILLGVATYILVGYASVITLLFFTMGGNVYTGYGLALLPSLLAIPFGILGIWILYVLLERSWSREIEKEEIKF
ncbi:MAG: hypothetical protein DCO96_11625 [Fluviicola sp. XM-24bin1]|nr:MAG: hypothetical protein DCO96_11625 [Fluviicola sp. XM-24bin1]